jgi:hypothetical protein
MAMGAHPEASLRQRTGEAFEQKHAIARWAASVIVPGENILLDAGSTVGALAHELSSFEKLSATTPGINTRGPGWLCREPCLWRPGQTKIEGASDRPTAAAGPVLAP